MTFPRRITTTRRSGGANSYYYGRRLMMMDIIGAYWAINVTYCLFSTLNDNAMAQSYINSLNKEAI